MFNLTRQDIENAKDEIMLAWVLAQKIKWGRMFSFTGWIHMNQFPFNMQNDF